MFAQTLRGQVVVLYFYPRADTPGCTVEACAFRDTYKQIQKTGAVLSGFLRHLQSAEEIQEKFKLPFPLLADADKKVAEAYVSCRKKHVRQESDGYCPNHVRHRTRRQNPAHLPKVKPEGHAVEVLAYLKESAKGAA